MSDFYTSCITRGDYLLYRGVKDSKRISRKVKYKPKLFIQTEKESKIKTFDGKFVESVSFDSIKEASDFVKRYEDVDNFEIFGNTGYNYVYVSDQFPKDIDFDNTKIVIAIIDIEVASNDGFPDPNIANQVVQSISLKLMYDGKEVTYVFACKNFTTDRQDIKFIKCDCEQTLLEEFVRVWSKFYPDIVTGWNCEKFDWLYLVNRLEKVYPNIGTKRLSPWGHVYIRDTKNFDGTVQKIPEILGIAILDYLDLYKKFSFKTQESYRLDYVCHVELDQRKLDYSEYSNLMELYEKDFQKFLTYNIRDVDLVHMLEKKLNLIQQAIQLAYDTKSNYTDVYMQVRMWDNLIYDHFRKNDLAFPFKKNNQKTEYAGAYVKDPITGFHKWVISMDVASMYPNLILQHNISPDTITGDHIDVDIKDLICKKNIHDFLTERNITLTANGQQFRRDKAGFLPVIIEKMYADRVKYKKLMIKKEKELETIEAEIKRRNI